MALVVLAILVAGLGMILLKVVSVLPGIALMLIGLFAVLAVGERRDRSRRRGYGDPSSRLDHRRGVIPTGMDGAPADGIDAYADTLVSHQLADPPPTPDKPK